LQEAVALKHTTVATFGGAWSNHIVAAAYACQEAGLKSIGIIRGEQSPALTATLKLAKEYGMELIFVTRESYRKKAAIINDYATNNWFWISEGGYGEQGAKGASEIFQIADFSNYTHIIAAVGTGTMLAGLVLSAGNHQKVIGISSMKGNVSLHEEVLSLTALQKPGATFQMIHDYHFGGYGKYPKPLIDFINDVHSNYRLPLDIIYTGKTFYAIKDLVTKKFFEPASKLLMIHSGGLQGNKSLPRELLAF
jgi:1-aminocyclopropane-1-carboxylate deaminase